jgi:hypothetical protein
MDLTGTCAGESVGGSEAVRSKGAAGCHARLVLTFRDLSGELHELDRFIPLCSSDDLIMTCLLEYEPTSVKVHDLIWVRQPDGWRFRKGVYRKLRLAPAAVVRQLENAAFTVERHEALTGVASLHPRRERPLDRAKAVKIRRGFEPTRSPARDFAVSKSLETRTSVVASTIQSGPPQPGKPRPSRRTS